MTRKKHYLPDISSILYLARMGKHHTNVYRFTMTMNEEVDPYKALIKELDKERYSVIENRVSGLI